VPEEYRIRPVSTGWKIPFNLALVFHILLLSSAIVLPKYIQNRPKLPAFTSVDLINISEILPLQEASAPQSTAPPKTTTPSSVTIKKLQTVMPKKLAPIAQTKTDSQAPAEAISIKPLKRKLKKKISPTANTHEKQLKKQAIEKRRLVAEQQQLEAQSRRLQQEADRQRAIADTEAQLAASEAIDLLRQSLRADAANSEVKNGVSRPRRSSGGSSSTLEAQYFASIFGHLHQYWSLPDIKQWDPDLTAVVVIQIAKNGTISSHRFEKSSGDRVFDQFVSRTIEDANPLPAIPGALREQQYTLGLRFKPGNIQ
jgi:colicin import membrane protein